MPRLIPVGTLDSIDVEKLARLRARIASSRAQHSDVWDARAQQFEPATAGATTLTVSDGPSVETTALVERAKWQGWAMLAAGALLGLLVAGAIWWYGQKEKAEASERRARSRSRARKAA